MGVEVIFGFNKDAYKEMADRSASARLAGVIPPGNGTWNGIFYPTAPGRRMKRAGSFDELRFYAEHFDTVEINSTFYGVPAVATARGWAERTPPASSSP